MNGSRSVRLITAAAAALLLSGCSPSQTPTETPAASATPDAGTDAGTDAESTVEETPAESTSVGSTLSFADGAALPASVYIQWADGLLADDGWTTVSPDNGDGGWTYGTADGACTAAFCQGYIADVEVVPGDDSASSDAMLAVLLDADLSTFAQYVQDGAFSYQAGGNTGVAHRQIAGQRESSSWLIAARAFAAVGVGAYVVIDCTTGDPNAILDKINEKNPIIAN